MIPKRLMLCVDKPATFEHYREEAGWLARQLDAEIILFHAVQPNWADVQPVVRTHVEEDLAIHRLAEDPALEGLKVSVECAGGVYDLGEAVLEAAERLEADAVVVPTHARRGLGRMVLGSVAERVVHSCRVPVFTFDLTRVPSKEEKLPFDRIVVPSDLSEGTANALSIAFDLAHRLCCPVSLIHVAQDPGADYAVFELDSVTEFMDEVLNRSKSRLESLARAVPNEHEVPFSVDIASGDVLKGVTKHVRTFRNPLVVMATAGHDSLGDHILGSTTERVIRGAGCSVLSWPASHFAATAEN